MKEKNDLEKKISVTHSNDTPTKNTQKEPLPETDAKNSPCNEPPNQPKSSNPVCENSANDLLTPVKVTIPMKTSSLTPTQKKSRKRSFVSGETTDSANEDTKSTSELVFYCI